LLIVSSSFTLLLDAGQSPAHVIELKVGPCLWIRILLTRIVVVIDTLVVYEIVSTATVSTWRRCVLCGLIVIFLLIIVIIVITCPIHHHVFVALYRRLKDV
jgi:hypothetical protein